MARKARPNLDHRSLLEPWMVEIEESGDFGTRPEDEELELLALLPIIEVGG